MRIVENIANDVFGNIGFEGTANAQFLERLPSVVEGETAEASQAKSKKRRDGRQYRVGVIVRQFDDSKKRCQ